MFWTRKPQTIIVKNGSGNTVISGGNNSGNGNGSSGNNGLTFENDPTTTLVIQKVADNAENTPLAGVEFLVTDGTGAVIGPNNGYYMTDKKWLYFNLQSGTWDRYYSERNQDAGRLHSGQ